MCGRYSISKNIEEIVENFKIEVLKDFSAQLFNAAPMMKLPVITNTDPKKLQLFSWGLIPSWSKDPTIGNKMINARGETIFEKPSFRSCIRNKRCLVPADSFYEWKKTEEKKQPFRIKLKKRGLFSLAGIWDEWKDVDGKIKSTFSIITTSPNNLMSEIHDRMPVILQKDDEEKWLLANDVNEISSLITSYPAIEMEACPISLMVNSPRNNSAEIHTPLN